VVEGPESNAKPHPKGIEFSSHPNPLLEGSILENEMVFEVFDVVKVKVEFGVGSNSIRKERVEGPTRVHWKKIVRNMNRRIGIEDGGFRVVG